MSGTAKVREVIGQRSEHHHQAIESQNSSFVKLVIETLNKLSTMPSHLKHKADREYQLALTNGRAKLNCPPCRPGLMFTREELDEHKKLIQLEEGNAEKPETEDPELEAAIVEEDSEESEESEDVYHGGPGHKEKSSKYVVIRDGEGNVLIRDMDEIEAPKSDEEGEEGEDDPSRSFVVVESSPNEEDTEVESEDESTTDNEEDPDYVYPYENFLYDEGLVENESEDDLDADGEIIDLEEIVEELEKETYFHTKKQMEVICKNYLIYQQDIFLSAEDEEIYCNKRQGKYHPAEDEDILDKTFSETKPVLPKRGGCEKKELIRTRFTKACKSSDPNGTNRDINLYFKSLTQRIKGLEECQGDGKSYWYDGAEANRNSNHVLDEADDGDDNDDEDDDDDDDDDDEDDEDDDDEEVVKPVQEEVNKEKEAKAADIAGKPNMAVGRSAESNIISTIEKSSKSSSLPSQQDKKDKPLTGKVSSPIRKATTKARAPTDQIPETEAVKEAPAMSSKADQHQVKTNNISKQRSPVVELAFYAKENLNEYVNNITSLLVGDKPSTRGTAGNGSAPDRRGVKDGKNKEESKEEAEVTAFQVVAGGPCDNDPNDDDTDKKNRWKRFNGSSVDPNPIHMKFKESEVDMIHEEKHSVPVYVEKNKNTNGGLDLSAPQMVSMSYEDYGSDDDIYTNSIARDDFLTPIFPEPTMVEPSTSEGTSRRTFHLDQATDNLSDQPTNKRMKSPSSLISAGESISETGPPKVIPLATMQAVPRLSDVLIADDNKKSTKGVAIYKDPYAEKKKVQAKKEKEKKRETRKPTSNTAGKYERRAPQFEITTEERDETAWKRVNGVGVTPEETKAKARPRSGSPGKNRQKTKKNASQELDKDHEPLPAWKQLNGISETSEIEKKIPKKKKSKAEDSQSETALKFRPYDTTKTPIYKIDSKNTVTSSASYSPNQYLPPSDPQKIAKERKETMRAKRAQFNQLVKTSLVDDIFKDRQHVPPRPSPVKYTPVVVQANTEPWKNDKKKQLSEKALQLKAKRTEMEIAKENAKESGRETMKEIGRENTELGHTFHMPIDSFKEIPGKMDAKSSSSTNLAHSKRSKVLSFRVQSGKGSTKPETLPAEPKLLKKKASKLPKWEMKRPQMKKPKNDQHPVKPSQMVYVADYEKAHPKSEPNQFVRQSRSPSPNMTKQNETSRMSKRESREGGWKNLLFGRFSNGKEGEETRSNVNPVESVSADGTVDRFDHSSRGTSQDNEAPGWRSILKTITGSKSVSVVEQGTSIDGPEDNPLKPPKPQQVSYCKVSDNATSCAASEGWSKEPGTTSYHQLLGKPGRPTVVDDEDKFRLDSKRNKNSNADAPLRDKKRKKLEDRDSKHSNMKPSSSVEIAHTDTGVITIDNMVEVVEAEIHTDPSLNIEEPAKPLSETYEADTELKRATKRLNDVFDSSKGIENSMDMLLEWHAVQLGVIFMIFLGLFCPYLLGSLLPCPIWPLSEGKSCASLEKGGSDGHCTIMPTTNGSLLYQFLLLPARFLIFMISVFVLPVMRVLETILRSLPSLIAVPMKFLVWVLTPLSRLGEHTSNRHAHLMHPSHDGSIDLFDFDFHMGDGSAPVPSRERRLRDAGRQFENWSQSLGVLFYLGFDNFDFSNMGSYLGMDYLK